METMMDSSIATESPAPHKTCGDCVRIPVKSLEKGYCPFTASIIHRRRTAERCKFFIDGSRREENVR